MEFVIGIVCGFAIGAWLSRWIGRYLHVRVKAPDIGMKLPDQLFMKVKCYHCGKENTAIMHILEQTITNG